MPSTATITAFYSFAANTRARASQVNDNFSIFRGHIIPVDPNTATAISNTYDLGSSEYKWRKGYINEIEFAGLTSTANYSFLPVPSLGGMQIKEGSTEFLRIPAITASQFTSTAAPGGIARSSTINFASVLTSNSVTNVTDSTCTITTLGRPVEVFLGPLESPSNQSGGIQASRLPKDTTDAQFDVGIRIVVNGTNTSEAFRFQAYMPINGLNGEAVSGSVPFGSVRSFLSLSAGTHTISLQVSNVHTATTFDIQNSRLYVREL